MAAVATLPSLSQLLDWPTEHLTDAAAQWEVVAERNYGLTSQVWRDASSVDWEGHAAEALRSATRSDMTAASAVADQLQAAAKVARSGAADLYAARSRLLYALEDAQSAGFDVHEEGSVVDRSTGGSAAQHVAREAEAEALAANIRERAGQLLAVDQQVASKVTAAIAGIRDTFPQSPTTPPTPTQPTKPKIRAVDNHTFKQDPAPPPGPGSDKPWEKLPSPHNAQDVRDALKQLERGHRKPNRQLDTPEEIQEFWDWLAKNARDLPSPGTMTRKVLDDGTEISVRPDSKSGGPTVEAIFPGAGKNPKVHFPLLPSVNNPPQVPPLLDHPPMTPAPPAPGHPLPAPLPPHQFADPADLPPWLKDPSPPGFSISPVQQPPAFDWDRPDAPAPPVSTQTSQQGGQSSWPQIGHDLAEAGKKTFAWIVVGGILVGGLLTAGGRLATGGPLQVAPAP
jgi:hypothetical protein